jgi:hypothetical protein
VVLGWYPYWHICGRIWTDKSLEINPYAPSPLLLGFINRKKKKRAFSKKASVTDGT